MSAKTFSFPAAWLMMLALSAVTGCSSMTDMYQAALGTKKQKNEAPTLPPGGPLEVRVDSTALALNQPEQELEKQRKFIERFQQLLNEDRPEAARLWAYRHPDFAWELLRDAQAPHEPWLLELAAFHDQQCVAAAEAGWRALLTAQNNSASPSPYGQTRQEFMQHLKNGRFAQAQKIDLVSLARQQEQPLLEIDAWHQTGIACLLTEQPQAAVGALEQCVRLAQTHAPYQAAHAQLLLSEMRRRAGDEQGAAKEWIAAVNAASDLLARPTPIADPTFWDRAMYLHPVSTAWPSQVGSRIEQLAQAGPSHANSADIERVVAAASREKIENRSLLYLSTCLGVWLHKRGDHQDGVVALKQAETLASEAVADWLRIAQAKAIAGLGQSSPATALLAELAARKEQTAVCRAAMADLGALQLSEGRVQQGLGLLRNALESETTDYWPGRADAEADYALALLMIGEESKGLAQLKQAKQQFEQAGDQESLAKCLWNEAKFYENADNDTELEVVQSRLNRMRL